MNVLSLFSGIGGLELGLERAGMRVVGQVEIDPFCRKVLAKHWPEVPRHDDVRTCVNWWRSEPRPRVDLVCGGFPCQPVSLAGRQLAQDDERWLWPALARVVRDLRPAWVLLENVPGLLGRGMGDVLGDLAASGYDAEWDCIPAAAVGAPHRRDRWFAVAYPSAQAGGRFGAGRRQQQQEGGRAPWDVADASRAPITRPERHPWTVEPDVGRSLDGFSTWLDRWGLAEACKLVSAHADAAQVSPAEAVRTVRRQHGTETAGKWPMGGRGPIPASAVLLAYLRQLEAACGQAREPLAGTEAPPDGMRGMRNDNEPARPPLRRQPREQRDGEPPDALRPLPQLLARAADKAWAAYRRSDAAAAGWHWEDGLARTATGVPARVDRLRALGNAVVPQVAEHIGRLILAADGRVAS